jgi:hypothetical protein
MMLVRSLVPVAIAVAVAGVLTLYLLADDSPLGPWLLAFLLVAHGWVHLLFAFPKPPSDAAKPNAPAYPFDFGRSWLIGRGGLDAGLVRRLGMALTVVVVGLHVLAALATVGVLVPVDWWASLVLLAALASALFLALFYSPLLLLGFAIDLAVVWLVLAGTWSPAAG